MSMIPMCSSSRSPRPFTAGIPPILGREVSVAQYCGAGDTWAPGGHLFHGSSCMQRPLSFAHAQIWKLHAALEWSPCRTTPACTCTDTRPRMRAHIYTHIHLNARRTHTACTPGTAARCQARAGCSSTSRTRAHTCSSPGQPARPYKAAAAPKPPQLQGSRPGRSKQTHSTPAHQAHRSPPSPARTLRTPRQTEVDAARAFALAPAPGSSRGPGGFPFCPQEWQGQLWACPQLALHPDTSPNLGALAPPAGNVGMPPLPPEPQLPVASWEGQRKVTSCC